jgi:phosphoribosyl-AMP cyclohydrolase
MLDNPRQFCDTFRAVISVQRNIFVKERRLKVTIDKSIEETAKLSPKFDSNGLIPAIAQDSQTGDVLMFAFMNAEALDKTIKTGRATYFSRSRGKLWTKGEQSGHFQKVDQILVDCDQDCILLKVTVDSGQCHAGYQSCFYRALKKGTGDKLDFIAKKVFDPSKVYDK